MQLVRGHGGYPRDSIRTHLIPCAFIPGTPNTRIPALCTTAYVKRVFKYPWTCQCVPRPAHAVDTVDKSIQNKRNEDAIGVGLHSVVCAASNGLLRFEYLNANL